MKFIKIVAILNVSLLVVSMYSSIVERDIIQGCITVVAGILLVQAIFLEFLLEQSHEKATRALKGWEDSLGLLARAISERDEARKELQVYKRIEEAKKRKVKIEI